LRKPWEGTITPVGKKFSLDEIGLVFKAGSFRFYMEGTGKKDSV